MGFSKLANPKPGKVALGPHSVSVAVRKAMKGARFLIVKIGPEVARKAGFQREQHRCHVLAGNGDDHLRCGITIDDGEGAFVVKRDRTGAFKLTISQRAAEGRFSLDQAAFMAAAEAVPVGTGPTCIIFTVPAGFRL